MQDTHPAARGPEEALGAGRGRQMKLVAVSPSSGREQR